MFLKFSTFVFPVILLSLGISSVNADGSDTPEAPSDGTDRHSSPIGLARDAARLVHGECINLFNYFINGDLPRVFAYSTTEGYGQACGAHVGDTIGIAREEALQRCNDKIKKRDGKNVLLDDCRIVAEDNKQLVGLADFGIDESAAYERALYITNLRGVKHYIEQGASINTLSKTGATAIHIAARYGDEEYFFELVDKGADIKHKLNDNSTLLFSAIIGSSPTIFRYLVNEGADVNHLQDNGYRPLHYALRLSRKYMVELLIELQADPALKTSKGISGYDMAEKWEIDLDTLKEVNLGKMDDGCTMARDAAKYGDLYRLEQLAETNVDFGLVCPDGGQQLALSWTDDNKTVIDFLIASGANVNARDFGGNTPLIVAAREGSLTKVRVLLSHGADKSLKNDHGETAFDSISSIDADELKVLLAP